jgi:predicted phosphodiesterase
MKNWIYTVVTSVLFGILVVAIVVGGIFFWHIFSASDAKSPDDFPTTEPTVALRKFVTTPQTDARTFLVSDIHGRFDSFQKALNAVHFSKSDHLYVLGDVVDRGNNGFEALLDLTKKWPEEGYKITVLMGNHEQMWYEIAANGKTDAQQLKTLEKKIASYHGNVPNGWSYSLKEWKKLSASDRQYLLKQLRDGFGNPQLLVTQVNGHYLALSHTADFSKPYMAQTAWDLGWNNKHMMNAPVTYRASLAKKLNVPTDKVQVFIGHISGVLFGQQPEFNDLDNTKVFKTNSAEAYREYGEIPVPIYQVETGKFYYEKSK